MLLTIKVWKIWLLRFKKVHKLYQGNFVPFLSFFFTEGNYNIKKYIKNEKRYGF